MNKTVYQAILAYHKAYGTTGCRAYALGWLIGEAKSPHPNAARETAEAIEKAFAELGM